MRVMSRLMGLLLASLAVQFIANGVRELDWSQVTLSDEVVASIGVERSSIDLANPSRLAMVRADGDDRYDFAAAGGRLRREREPVCRQAG